MTRNLILVWASCWVRGLSRRRLGTSRGARQASLKLSLSQRRVHWGVGRNRTSKARGSLVNTRWSRSGVDVDELRNPAGLLVHQRGLGDDPHQDYQPSPFSASSTPETLDEGHRKRRKLPAIHCKQSDDDS